MASVARIVSSVGFAAAGGLTLLPLVGVGVRVGAGSVGVRWRGSDLTFGGNGLVTIDVPVYGPTGYALPPQTPSEFVDATGGHAYLSPQAGMIVSVVLIAAGLLTPILATRRLQAAVAAVAGFVGATALVVGVLTAMLQARPATTLEAAPEPGLWVVLVLLTALGVFNVVLLARTPRADPVGRTPEPA
jgi:hypothetical protein